MNNQRIAKVLSNMAAAGLSQLLVTAPASVGYLTGAFIQPGERLSALYLNDSGDVRLVSNRLFSLAGTVEPLTEYDDTDDSVAVLAEYLKPGTLGIDKTWPSGFLIRLMAMRGDIRPADGSRPVDDARMIKGEDELELMRQSSRMNVKACALTAEQLTEGMTETDAARLYEKNALAVGGAGNSFTPITCFGANCAEPHHDNDETRLKKGDSVILDVGLLHQRYCSDMTRSLCFGGSSARFDAIHDIVYRANRAGIAAARPGARMCDIDRAARKVIEDAGYGRYFTHRLGHGIGLEVHEFPDCSSVNTMTARKGMVFSIEPGIYLPGEIGVRYEDLIAITDDGCEVLTE